MKGFVPVDKASLLEMTKNCHEAILADFDEKYQNEVESLINYEKKRSTTRRWYRLWLLPKPRFFYTTPDVLKFSNERDYDLFEGCPFESLEKDKINSIKWVCRMERLAESNFAGEPILLDIKTFNRMSDPSRWNWVNTNSLFYTLDR